MDEEIGGIPWGFLLLKDILPTNKKKRYMTIMAITTILTYVTYIPFVSCRVPIRMVQMKVIQACNETENSGDDHVFPWCRVSEFGKTPHVTMVVLVTIFYASYGLSLHLSGCLADYFNPRYYLCAGCMFVSFFCVCLGLANLWDVGSMHYMATCYIMLGFAESTAWPIILSCTTYWFAGARQGLFFAIWNTHYYLGSILGIYLSYSVLETHWGLSFILPGLFVATMTLFVFIFLVAHPSDLRYLYKEKQKGKHIANTPAWMNQWASLDYSDTFKVPGLLEFCVYMFFARMISYNCSFYLPFFLTQADPETEISPLSHLNLPYVIGGILGGISCGVLKDLHNKSALICICFFTFALPLTALNLVHMKSYCFSQILLHFLMGISVEGPYILVITSVSADLGTHPLIRRQHRGIATMAAIIESSGVLGASLVPLINYNIMTYGDPENHIFLLMLLLELFAALSLMRMAWRDYHREEKKMSIRKYLLDQDCDILEKLSYF